MTVGQKRRAVPRKMEGKQHRRQDRQTQQTVTVAQRRRRRTWKGAKVRGTRRVQQQRGSNKRMDRRGKCFS